MRDITILLLTSVCVGKYGGAVIDLDDLDEESYRVLFGERDPVFAIQFPGDEIRDPGFYGAIDRPPERLVLEPPELPEDRPSWAFPRDTYRQHRPRHLPQHVPVRRGCRHK